MLAAGRVWRFRLRISADALGKRFSLAETLTLEHEVERPRCPLSLLGFGRVQTTPHGYSRG